MAQASVLRHTRYFCHRCNVEINPNLQDFTCPTCLHGFVEEMAVEPVAPAPLIESASNPSSMLFSPLMFQTVTDSSTSGDDQSSDSQSSEAGTSAGHRNIRFYPRYPQSRRRIRVRGPNGPYQNIWEHVDSVLFGLTGGVQAPVSFGALFGLHGNPADYAWGSEGIDNIITRLLNQMEGSGPPPAKVEEIEALPVVKISSEEMEKKEQCSICCEEYEIDSEASAMPCKHLFHRECLAKWLRLHDTCPVCRKNLSGQSTVEASHSSNNSNVRSEDSTGADRRRRTRPSQRFQIN